MFAVTAGLPSCEPALQYEFKKMLSGSKNYQDFFKKQTKLKFLILVSITMDVIGSL